MADRKPKGTIVQAPDFALLVVGASRPVAERLNAAVAAAGIDDMRSPYGFVIRALAREPLGLTELAEYLGVTKQAAIKVVDEMEARGLLVREPHPADRRGGGGRARARGPGGRRCSCSRRRVSRCARRRWRRAGGWSASCGASSGTRTWMRSGAC